MFSLIQRIGVGTIQGNMAPHIVRPDTITCILLSAAHYIILLAVAMVNMNVL